MELQREKEFMLKKLKVKLLSVAIAVSISGCATSTPQYKEPTGQSVAPIDFMNETLVPMMLYFYADAAECTDRTFAGLIQPKTLKTLHVSTDKELAFRAVVNLQQERDKNLSRVGALGGALGALAVIAVTVPAVKDECMPTIDFLPEAGRNYVFQLNSDGNNCSYTFVSRPTQSQQSDDAVPVSFTKREWIRPWGESGPFCKKK
jgi:hypothetical protein